MVMLKVQAKLSMGLRNSVKPMKKANLPLQEESETESCSASDEDCSLFQDIDFVLGSTHAQRIVKAAKERVNLPHHDEDAMHTSRVPCVSRKDVQVGRTLGIGGFGLVKEVQGIKRNVDGSASRSDRMVLKTLKPQRYEEQLLLGCHQLELEKRTLQILDHPNIIRLRGCSKRGLDSVSKTKRLDSCFLLLDYLPETLTDRIETWRQKANANNKKRSSMWKGSKDKLDKDLFREQLQTAIDIASALEYLHQKRIILRDLKPDNVGFDEHGNLKLFDFGLAAHLPSDCCLEDTHQGLGMVGTPRYMATEVAREEPYNHKADTFSFSLVLWHMLTQEKPLGIAVSSSVYGERPSLPKQWPVPLRRIMSRGWSDDLNERPCMTEFKFALEDLLRQHC